MKAFLLDSIRWVGVLWAKSGVACGWLYQWLEQIGPGFSGHRRVRRLQNGLVMECDLRDHVQRQIYFLGGYEPIEAELFLSLLLPGSTVIDAGANVGFYSLMMAERVGPEGRVHSFEPVAENFEVLLRHVAINALEGRMVLNHRALWHREERLRFSLPEGHGSNAGGYSAAEQERPLRQVECEAIALDQYVTEARIARVDAIKMDIEGAEQFALQGAVQTLKQRPLIFLEVCQETCRRFGYEPAALWEILKPFGYRIYRIGSVHSASGWVDDFSGIVQSNVLLIPKDYPTRLQETWDDKAIRRKYARGAPS